MMTDQPPTIGRGLHFLVVAMTAVLLSSCTSHPQAYVERPRYSLWTNLAGSPTASPFSAYDHAIIERISERWYDLLDGKHFKTGSGLVIVSFHLHPDGTISDLNVQKNEADRSAAAISQQAIENAAPFAPWPTDMVRMAGKDYREVTFRFTYH